MHDSLYSLYVLVLLCFPIWFWRLFAACAYVSWVGVAPCLTSIVHFLLQWDYDDGFSSAAGRFHIDLFEAYGSGDCVTFYAVLCDKESIGCKDNREFATLFNVNMCSNLRRLAILVLLIKNLFDTFKLLVLVCRHQL